eukprot:3403237-Rhodomonas_salina.2
MRGWTQAAWRQPAPAPTRLIWPGAAPQARRSALTCRRLLRARTLALLPTSRPPAPSLPPTPPALAPTAFADPDAARPALRPQDAQPRAPLGSPAPASSGQRNELSPSRASTPLPSAALPSARPVRDAPESSAFPPEGTKESAGKIAADLRCEAGDLVPRGLQLLSEL